MKNLRNTLKLTAASAVCFGVLTGANIASAESDATDATDATDAGGDAGITVQASKVIVGGGGSHGTILLKKSTGTTKMKLIGRVGTIQNAFTGNGTVKAWAQINANGTIDSCWRCNQSVTETKKLSTGRYEVDFTPLGADIRSRPRLATIDGHDSSATSPGIIYVETRSGDSSSVYVDLENESGAADSDRPFTLVIL